jgi:tetraacyldisaccharide 4'-kinase
MKSLIDSWYQKKFFTYGLLPFSFIYKIIVVLRKKLYDHGFKKITRFPVPIIVVGNIGVGGTGKTPLVAYLATWLRDRGIRPGIVSRGYGGKLKNGSRIVRKDSDPREVGDEPVMLASQTDCPMVVAKDRVLAVKKLLTEFACDVVISDDGLQHYSLGRDIEIAVVDSNSRFGNGYYLPAGPLREQVTRLAKVDLVIVNGRGQDEEMTFDLIPKEIYYISEPSQKITLEVLKKRVVHAVAGIGRPEKFFSLLRKLGLQIIPHEFPDHYFYQKKDIDFGEDAWVIMTEKDAVKCQMLVDERHFCLRVGASVDERFMQSFVRVLQAKCKMSLSENAHPILQNVTVPAVVPSEHP